MIASIDTRILSGPNHGDRRRQNVVHPDGGYVDRRVCYCPAGRAGEAWGAIDGLAWRTPAAWKAVIRDGRMAEWRVFAGNKPVYEILAKRQR